VDVSRLRVKNTSPPEGSEKEAVGVGVSPFNIFALSRAKTAIRRGRPSRRPEIMTFSPFNNSLLNIIKKKRTKNLLIGLL
jgi:hypothetical protein